MSNQHSKPETERQDLSHYGVKGAQIHTYTPENARRVAKKLEELNKRFPIGEVKTLNRKVTRL